MEQHSKAVWAKPVLEEISISETAGKNFGNQEAGQNNKKTPAGS